MRTLIQVLVLTMAVALEATAQTRRTSEISAPVTGRYSLLGGETVGTGVNVVSGEFGWPSVTFGITHGLSRETDVGAKFDLLFGVDLNMTLYVTPSPVSFWISPMFGPAVEFHVDPRLAVGINTRFGPVLPSTGGSSFGFVTQLMLAYRM